MLFALIDPRSNRVAQIATKTFPVAPPLEWVEVDDSVTTQHTYEDGKIVAPIADEPETKTVDEIAALKARVSILESAKR